ELGEAPCATLAGDLAVDAIRDAFLGPGVDELEDGVAHANLVVRLELDLGHVPTVDHRPVAATEVLEEPAVVLGDEPGVLAAHRLLRYTNEVRRVATDRKLGGYEDVGRAELLEVRRVEQDEACALLRGGRGVALVVA